MKVFACWAWSCAVGCSAWAGALGRGFRGRGFRGFRVVGFCFIGHGIVLLAACHPKQAATSSEPSARREAGHQDSHHQDLAEGRGLKATALHHDLHHDQGGCGYGPPWLRQSKVAGPSRSPAVLWRVALPQSEAACRAASQISPSGSAGQDEAGHPRADRACPAPGSPQSTGAASEARIARLAGDWQLWRGFHPRRRASMDDTGMDGAGMGDAGIDALWVDQAWFGTEEGAVGYIEGNGALHVVAHGQGPLRAGPVVVSAPNAGSHAKSSSDVSPGRGAGEKRHRRRSADALPWILAPIAPRTVGLWPMGTSLRRTFGLDASPRVPVAWRMREEGTLSLVFASAGLTFVSLRDLGPKGIVRRVASPFASQVRSRVSWDPVKRAWWVLSPEGMLHALDEDAKLRWRHPLKSSAEGGPTFHPKAHRPTWPWPWHAVVGTDLGDVVAMSREGEESWRIRLGGAVRGTPAFLREPEGAMAVPAMDGTLTVIGGDGARLWSYATGGALVSSPCVDEQGTIFVGSRDHSLYAFSSIGALLWHLDIGASMEVSPSLRHDGILLVADDEGTVHAIGPARTP